MTFSRVPDKLLESVIHAEITSVHAVKMNY